jgi:hypothetical protein
MRILFFLAALALLAAGCSSLAQLEGAREEAEPLPRQLQARQLIVTLPPAAPEVRATVAQELSGEYVLDQVGAFPLSSLGVQCIGFQVGENRPLDDVLARLTADPRVEAPRHVMELLLSTARPTLRKAGETGAPLWHVDACAALQRLVPAAWCP